MPDVRDDRLPEERFAIDTSDRLQRVLAARGAGSRRKAEDLIRAGRVTVDGSVVTELGTKVDPQRAKIAVDGRLLRPQPLRYVLLNKPRGYITTTSDERSRRTVMDLIQTTERIYPVGRLDRDTDGLLLLTNDGDVANRMMHPRYGLAKEYNVLTPLRPTERTMEQVRQGIVVDGKRVAPDEFRILRETREGILLTITLREGMNRIARRIMEAVGIEVSRLRRVRIGPLSLAGIPEGEWRPLTPGELTTLYEALRLDATDASVAKALHGQRKSAAGRPDRASGPPRRSDRGEGSRAGERRGRRPSDPGRGAGRRADDPARRRPGGPDEAPSPPQSRHDRDRPVDGPNRGGTPSDRDEARFAHSTGGSEGRSARPPAAPPRRRTRRPFPPPDRRRRPTSPKRRRDAPKRGPREAGTDRAAPSPPASGDRQRPQRDGTARDEHDDRS